MQPCLIQIKMLAFSVNVISSMNPRNRSWILFDPQARWWIHAFIEGSPPVSTRAQCDNSHCLPDKSVMEVCIYIACPCHSQTFRAMYETSRGFSTLARSIKESAAQRQWDTSYYTSYGQSPTGGHLWVQNPDLRHKRASNRPIVC